MKGALRIRPNVLAILGALALACDPFGESSGPVAQWPAPRATPADSQLAAQARAAYLAAGYDARRNFVTPYAATGDYLRYGVTQRFRDAGRIKLDTLGLPMVLYDTTFYYNPVTLAQYGLAAHGRWLAGRAAADSIATLRAAAAVRAMVTPVGSIPYPFRFTLYFSGMVAPAGWVSGMAQGQALSLLARAYAMTGDKRYLESGRRVLAFLRVPIEQGGTATTMAGLHPSLRRFPIYEEYPATPASYTLNGFLFTLLGIYDWSAVDPMPRYAARARSMFEAAMPTVEGILPLYDIGGFTAYDLAFLTYPNSPHVSEPYHSVHIYLLHALHSVYPSPLLREYECRWLDEVAGAGACDASH